MRPLDLLPVTGPGRYVDLAGDAGPSGLDAHGWTATPADASDGGVLAVVTTGPEAAVADAVDALAGRPAGDVLLFTQAPIDAPALAAAVGRIATLGFEVAVAAAFADDRWRAGVRFTPAPDELAEGRRALADRAIAALAAAAAGDEVEATVLQRRVRSVEAARARESARASALEDEVARLQRELALERRRLTDIERSTSYKLGQAVVQTARDPRQVAQRSRELLDRWRKRGRGPGDAATPGRSSEADLEAPRDRTPIPTTVPAVAVPTPAVPVVAVVTDATAQALASEVLLTRALPHDAAQLVDSVAPAVVLIESEAAAPGQPWAGAGTGAVPSRDADLIDLLRAADRVGAATVLAWTGPRWRAPGLRAVARRCTLEVAADGPGTGWTLGPPPGLVAGGAAPADRDRTAALDLRGDLRLPRELRDRVTVVGSDVGGEVARAPWSVWGQHPSWLVPADGPDRWQAAAASIAGAVPLVAGGVPEALADLGAVPYAEAAAAPSWTQRRRAVLTASTHATLRSLGDLLGRDLVPVTSRSIAVRLAAPDDRHLDLLLGQEHLPPGCVAVTDDPLPDAAVAALAALGHRAATWVPAGVRFTAALDAARHGTDHLADLLARWELDRNATTATGDPVALDAATVGQVPA